MSEPSPTEPDVPPPNIPEPAPSPDVPEPAPSPDPVPSPQTPPGQPDPGPGGEGEHPLEADYPDADEEAGGPSGESGWPPAGTKP